MYDIFYLISDMYYLKRDTIILESIDKNRKYEKKVLKKFQDFEKFPKSFQELQNQINVFHDFISHEIVKKIGEKAYEEYANVEYETYTDEFYHRRYWNEIPNTESVTYFVKIFSYLNHCDYSKSKPYSIWLYDLNDEALFFSTEKDAENFIQLFDCVPCSLMFEDDNTFEEIYSI